MKITVKNAVFWDVTPRGSYTKRRFGGTYRLHDQGENIERDRNNVGNNVSPKRLFLQETHGVTSHETEFFIVTAVITSILT
jgi:hypothetical protein